MRIIYIAHPISGDVPGNINKILAIVKEINLKYPEVVPFAPYVVDCLAMNDDIPEERERGIKNDIALFNKGFIDAVFLCGDRISAGMQAEKELAEKLGIQVINGVIGERL